MDTILQFRRMELLHTQVLASAKKHEANYKNQLLLALSNSSRFAHSSNSYEQISAALLAVCQTGAGQDCEEFFREIGIDRKAWAKLQTPQERYSHILRSLQHCIQENRKKVNTQIDNYLANTKKPAPSVLSENKSKDSFDWLKLKNKYPMCQPKLKAKLVQAISDNKNQTRIRQRMADPDNVDKVSLLDESLVLDQYQRIKIDYSWTEEDERLFIANINTLKNKFNKTEFLKRCGRFRFISDHELETLAAEEISRRLDQNNKVYLSREFLLDKYYSTTDFLTQQEMRFILKTSPLLSKCVDKNFIRAAIKNVQYEDINRLELKIAENIISRFDQIRRAVKESRKLHKQTKNNEIKERIVEFEKRQEFEIIREMAREELKKHKLAKGSKSTASLRSKPMNLQNKKKYIPLNQYHPPSGLFVKDCNEQCNDDLFNHYERGYIEKEKKPAGRTALNRASLSMFQFYTGGPENGTPKIPEEAISTICKLIKAQFYEKSIKECLGNYQIPNVETTTNRTANSAAKQPSCYDLDRRPRTVQKLASEQSSEAVIKRKILDSKEKAKAVVYVNKLLAFAAENSFASLRALNAKFTPEQVNTRDHRGNTALYYASKNQNLQFVSHLLNFGADPSLVCEKQNTPLHHIFKSNNVSLIIRCLCSHRTPNLNALNSQNKTPLAYCTHDTLAKLYLQDGVLTVQNRRIQFDNNYLLTQEKLDRLAEAMGWDNGRANSRAKLL